MMFGKLGKRVAEALDIPKEVYLNLPRIIMTGNTELYLCGYKALNDYSEKEIRLISHDGVIAVAGENLVIKSIENEEIIISGSIISVNFM